MDPLVLVGAGVVAALVIAVLAKLLGSGAQAGAPPGARSTSRQMKRDLEAGDLEAAANRAAQSGDLATAFELYVRAQQPARAAQIAMRQGKLALAGELYEKAGDPPRAAAAYRQAGMNNKANEIDPRVAPQSSAASVPLVFGTDGKGPAKITGPAERAEEAEAQWRAASKEVLPGDTEGQGRLRGYAEAAAEAWLSAGEIKRAADLCREAGLVDQAVNLFVNVLGDPGSAAQLVAQRGDHKRAAELYEMAGQKERSLQSWIEWSQDAGDPLEHVADVRRLGNELSSRLFQAIVSQRPLSSSNVELHYRVAMAMEDAEDAKHARAVFERISSIDPGFRDVKQRIARLQNAATMASPKGEARAPAPGLGPLEPGVMESLVSDVASRAAEMIKREAMGGRGGSGSGTAMGPAVTSPSPGVRPPPGPSMPGASVVNVQQHVDVTQNISFHIAGDAAVRDAKRGPSVQELRKIIADHAPDLGNIEVYYRLGLAHLARGQYEDAKEAFASVEDVSPGYRDAAVRASQISSWKDKVATSVFSAAAGKALGNRYAVEGELGRGGMAVVYRARDEALGREVALKFLTEEAVGNAVFMQFFQREARAAGSLNHPNIVTIYDIGELEGRAFICMELVDGVTIDSILERDKCLPLADCLRIIEQVLVALEYAHGRKIIHRDIKPANIMQTASRHVKLMDFGLAKSIEGTAKTTVISGTPSYMAPEQLTGKDLDARADLFAVGATLYEMLSGEIPFHGMVRVEPPRSVRASMPIVPVALDDVLQRSMEFAKEKRFASATEMLVPIRQLMADLQSAPREAASPATTKQAPSAARAGGTMLGVAPPSAAAERTRKL